MKNYINRILQCCYICKDYDNMKTFYSEILELKKTKSDKFTREIIDYFKSRGFICNHQPGDEYMSCFSVADEESIVLLNIQYEGKMKQIIKDSFTYVLWLKTLYRRQGN